MRRVGAGRVANPFSGLRLLPPLCTEPDRFSVYGHASFPLRDRRIIDRLRLGERTGAVAPASDLSPGRVAQSRRRFHAYWLRFGAAPGEGPSSTALL
jgi:hypothetical protein